jgi:NADH:ubiquinone oxidoreductase subunit 2 (subunit N)
MKSEQLSSHFYDTDFLLFKLYLNALENWDGYLHNVPLITKISEGNQIKTMDPFTISPTDFYFLIADFFLIFSAIVCTIYAVFYSTKREYRYPTLRATTVPLALFILFCTAILVINNPLQKGIIFFNCFIFDDLSLYIRIITCIGGSAALLLGNGYFQKESQNNFEYIIFILLAIFSMFLLASSFDFLAMYLAIELQSLCFYVCAASKRYSEFSTEAGLKYFILGAFSSGLLLFGISFIYGFTGISNFSNGSILTATFPETITANGGGGTIYGWAPVTTGYIFLAIGLLFKLAAAPFHMWSPDVYEGAPTPFTAFFAINGKSSILAVFLRIYTFLPVESNHPLMDVGEKQKKSIDMESNFLDTYFLPLPSLLPDPLTIIFFCSIASMIIGCFAAISQKKVKRVLAYSSIAHVGFILIGFCCGTIAGYQSICIYLFIYIIMNCGIFAIVLLPIHRTDLNESTYGAKYLTDFAYSAKTNVVVAFSFALFMFSLAAIPPTVGFYSKAFLFFSAMGSGKFLLAVVAIFTSVCSCFYYIRFCRNIYFYGEGKIQYPPLHFNRIEKENGYVAAISFFITVFGIGWTAPLYSFTNKIAIYGAAIPF